MRKTWVEQCLPLDLDEWVRAGYLDADEPHCILSTYYSQTTYVRNDWDPSVVSIAHQFDPAQSQVMLTIAYVDRYNRQKFPQTRLKLSQSELAWGAKRWWVHCPCASYSVSGVCDRRVRKLYLSPAGWYVACRTCHDLTYRSCTESHHLNSKARKRYPATSEQGEKMMRAVKLWGKRKRDLSKIWQSREARRRRRKANGWS